MYSIPKELKKRTDIVAKRLGDRNDLPSLDDITGQLAPQIAAARKRHHNELKQKISTELATLNAERKALVERQRQERKDLRAKQQKRATEEALVRQSRFRMGLGGIWDRLRGEHTRIRKRNEREATEAQFRDNAEKEKLIQFQHAERRMLKAQQIRQLSLARSRLDEFSRSVQEYTFER